MEATVSKRPPPKVEVSLDSWAKSATSGNGCHTCRNVEAAEAIRACLSAIERTGARHVTLRQILKKVQELVPSYKIGYWGFRDHLYNHEADLYNRAKGSNV